MPESGGVRSRRDRAEAVSWPGWLGFGVAGSALVLACCGDWRAAGMAVVVALLPLVAWVCGEMAATRRLMRGTGRHRKRPVSLDAALAALRRTHAGISKVN